MPQNQERIFDQFAHGTGSDYICDQKAYKLKSFLSETITRWQQA